MKQKADSPASGGGAREQRADEGGGPQRFLAVSVPLEAEAPQALPQAQADKDGSPGEQLTGAGEPQVLWQVVPEQDGVLDLDEAVCSCQERRWALRIRDLFNAEDRSLDGRLASLSGDKETK